MKFLRLLLPVISCLVLFSCNIGKHNFNKQKYTTLKSKETKTEVVPTESSQIEADPIVFHEEPETNEPTNSSSNEPSFEEEFNPTSIDDSQSTLFEEQNYDTEETYENSDPVSETPPKAERADEPEEREGGITSEQGLLIAWTLYLLLGIVSMVLLWSYLLIGLSEIFLFIGFAIWPVLIIYGIVLFILALRESKENNSGIMMMVKIATLVELIIATVGTVILAVILGFIFLLGW